MHQPSTRWTKPFLTKVVVISVILLISLQYFVNVVVFRQNESVIFLRLLDSSVEKMLNQSSLVVQQSMRQTVTKIKERQELCPIIPPKLKGSVKVNVQVAAWAYIQQQNTMLDPGGRYQPANCQARHRVAVVIPYRDREIHLKIFLKNIHPFLRRQQLDYGIFVVEMAADIRFNRALLMNVGFVEAMKQHDYQCFIFHDVDLLPEDDRNLYTCPQTPRHMSVAIDRMQYKLPYSQIFGGVSAITTEHFRKINGFSNIFFGWGGEDDDMYRRILYSNLTVIRYSPEVARYKMLVHAKEHGNNDRFLLLRTVKARRETDGLSSLKYKVEKLELRPLFTWILVSVNETEIVEAEPIHKLANMNLKRKQLPNKPQSVKVVNSDQAAQEKIVKKNKDIKNNTKKSEAVGQTVVKAGNAPRINKTVIKHIDVNRSDLNSGKHEKTKVKEKTINDLQKSLKTLKMLGKPKTKILINKSPTVVSWIPTDFKGILPTNLTKFEPLPIIVPPHMKKRKSLKQNLANKKAAQRQALIRSQNLMNNQKAGKNVENVVFQKLPQNVKVVRQGSIEDGNMNLLVKKGGGNIPVGQVVQSVHDLISVHDYIPDRVAVGLGEQIKGTGTS